nr:unnamed protein product [Callosobruchus chinensis]
MAAGMGNVYRLPQTALIRGGLPFVVAHTVLTLLVGLPLLFLELGVGQMAQEGVVKAWRAVPFFKGIGYVKLLAGCLISIYYPLYMGLSTFYVIWLLKGPAPFQECSARVKMTEVRMSCVIKKNYESSEYKYSFCAGYLTYFAQTKTAKKRKSKYVLKSFC